MLTQYPMFYGPLDQMVMQWSQIGVFTVLLPFVLVFAVVFAILEKIDLLKNRGVHTIIALAIAFFTISNPYVTSFFVPLFSNLGLGVAILITLVILLGLAINPEGGTWRTIFTIVGIGLFIVILARAKIFDYLNVFGYCDAYCQSVTVFIIIVAMAVFTALFFGKKKEERAMVVPVRE